MKIASTLSIALLFSINSAAMTQTEFVERLKNNHPFFAQQKLDQQTTKLDYIASSANQDWILSSSIDSANKLNIQTSSATIGATRNLASTGADLVVSNVWSDGTATDKLVVSYTQPLLKNAFGVNDLLATDLSKIKIDIDMLIREQSAEVFILAQLYKLVDLSYAQQQLMLANHRLTLAKQELSLMKDKFEQSIVDRVDVLLQEDSYQRVLQKQLQAEQDLDLLKQELSIVLSVSIGSVYSDYDLYQLYQSMPNNLQVQLEENTAEMKLAKLEQAVLKRQLLSDKNSTQAQLDLTLGATNENNNNWNIGLGLSYPLGNTEAKSTLEKTQIGLAKIKQSTAEQLLNLTVKAGVLTKKLQHLTKLLNTYQARIKIAEARALAEKKRYELGNSQVSFVISAQNNVHDVNLAYAQAAVKYQKSVLEFKAVIDQLL
ncbi:hypothetical protein BHECKSOX_1122 [Bathymodiolus heckerae thiotrophic gill symbiont]|uniref:TolC family protein n=1 Tax=Bathymodiolus heckerae thiotrophic gill symbiont TaxID=1052212 RepID=UPI0010B776C8|nr:TolC family protein [Bathymodiolus heckerae thiotrophic gill symbiont]CAC9592293.1 hypothetical protein [uncultured Gammaproteobacteria bacterium]CAC9962809.1 hypothetical protein [uncultured Gammaproteobacteria bacterium]SHN90926.1 hypothetical protein BHECKSOX_1122 [Bathymodiolus heckerae thiotrophic gill symbiont]